MTQKWLFRSLTALGALSFAAIVALAGFVGVQYVRHSGDDAAKFEDVRFVLNWCELGDRRFVRVVHSHSSARSFTGDHLDAYAIEISNVSPSELVPTDVGGWNRGDRLPKPVSDAVGFVEAARTGEVAWLPSESEIRTQNYFAYLWSMQYHGTYPTAVELILVRPADNMVFYVGGKT